MYIPVLYPLDRQSRDYRDSIMPDSPPDSKVPAQTTTSPSAPAIAGVAAITRPVSRGSSMSGLTGSHSPLSSMNGRTPSPPSMGSTASSQQLPPACGARQLSKLKRFLTTLQQFGSDISPEIGERVRTLVLGLVNSHLSIEEFHAKLQEATNFPLRPFVIPFLKANLPLLQRELLHCARMAKQTTQQYLAHNEHVLFDANSSPTESHDASSSELNENGKRRSPDRPKENGVDPHLEAAHPAKRHHPISPLNTSRVSPNGPISLNSGGPIRLEDISLSRELRERERLERERAERERLDRERERERFYPTGFGFSRDPYEPLDRLDDDWKHVETMLHCIIGMVDKTKRALAVLQERSLRDREELSTWMRRHAEGMDHDMKKRHNEMMAHTLRQTEDRVSEVKRRAEEAVNEVKRQAVSELQKAVAAAEQKANELVAAERTKMERSVTEARKTAQEEAVATINQQEESNENCWNCGRKASETCSGCNVARYCGAFCQHKDWENHHHVCGKTAAAAAAAANNASTTVTTPSSTTSAASTTTAETREQRPASSTSSPNGTKLPREPTLSPRPATSPVNSTSSRSSTPADSKVTESGR